ncbi:MarR family winged helix-turn-helix transcriptional regulator [Streptomyces halobius]|uniref:MarR family winged helix-turn-helix transcriptional regulator n=1 Tax=Streptomyces halobius TaxID=2879846 RepID=A0ABY4MGJ6_9ACTN|nr:MarR family winged helix-turn-helix transcriptional regulator [Streptomyces halobius]UQA95486.1 MarR family winged helix-turn-helix transcriptional regulator [Streptomyces halobius]
MSGYRTIGDTEKAVRARIGDTPVRHERMAAVAGIHRAAAAVRQHFENSVLRAAELTWTGFVVLWVVWIRGETETRRVAEEAGISKGTLTGVARTLQGRGLLERHGHPTDGRLALLSLTPEGERLMATTFPLFHAEEVFVTEELSDDEALTLADLLRRIVVRVETHGADRRRELLDGEDPRPRRSGRRARGVAGAAGSGGVLGAAGSGAGSPPV